MALLEREMREQGLSQAELARKAGIDTTTMYQILHRRRVPHMMRITANRKTMRRIAAGLGKPPTFFERRSQIRLPARAPAWAKALRLARIELGLTQRQVGQRMGLHSTLISQIERGVKDPRRMRGDRKELLRAAVGLPPSFWGAYPLEEDAHEP